MFAGRILPVHLQVLVTAPLDAAAEEAIGWSGEQGVLDARFLFSYFRMTADRRIIFGGEPPRYYWGGGAAPADSESQALERVAEELSRTFPVPLQVAGGWGGVIGYVLDALPAIGRLPACPRVVHAVGWCGHGVGLATASGKWVAQILCDGAAPADLPWFRAAVPHVPTELARYVGFAAFVKWMGLMDRLQ
jgi:glycine/D-amino acid oxidase-like deaminating enzyme